MEKARNPFVAGEGSQKKNILAERSRDCEAAGCLHIRHASLLLRVHALFALMVRGAGKDGVPCILVEFRYFQPTQPSEPWGVSEIAREFAGGDFFLFQDGLDFEFER